MVDRHDQYVRPLNAESQRLIRVIVMICGELCNFGGVLKFVLHESLTKFPVAYAFVEAIVVVCISGIMRILTRTLFCFTQTPLGALSVVISAILAHFILKEKLSLFGWIGCVQCILGAIVIALNAPEQQSVSTIQAFKKLFLAPGFLSYGSCCIAAALFIILWVAPRYGKKTMIWYITICSVIGGISVSCTQGLGACIVTSIRGDNQVSPAVC